LASIQRACQIRIRHIAVHATGLQCVQIGPAIKSAVGQHLARCFSAASFYLVDHGQQGRVIGGLLCNPHRHDEMILADRQFSTIAQAESSPALT